MGLPPVSSGRVSSRVALGRPVLEGARRERGTAPGRGRGEARLEALCSPPAQIRSRMLRSLPPTRPGPRPYKAARPPGRRRLLTPIVQVGCEAPEEGWRLKLQLVSSAGSGSLCSHGGAQRARRNQVQPAIHSPKTAASVGRQAPSVCRVQYRSGRKNRQLPANMEKGAKSDILQHKLTIRLLSVLCKYYFFKDMKTRPGSTSWLEPTSSMRS